MTRTPRHRDNPSFLATEEEAERLRMHPSPVARQQVAIDPSLAPAELQQPEYPPDILPVYVAKLYGVSHTPGDPGTYPDPPPPPSDTASGLDPIVPVPPPVDDPPLNTTLPAVMQDGATMTCTMGEWTGEPTGYSYVWQLDDAPAGSDQATLPLTVEDVDKLAVCTVTATNAAGSVAAPPSVGVIVTAFT